MTRDREVNAVSDKSRVNVRLTPEAHAFYKEEAEKLGYTMHGFLVLALNTFKEEYQEKQKKKG